MLMKKAAVTLVALAAAASAHAQLVSPTTSAGTITETAGTPPGTFSQYGVSFALPNVIPAGFPPFYEGTATLGFSLSSATDVTFSLSSSASVIFSTLYQVSGSTSPVFTPLTNFGASTETLDLGAGTYSYSAFGVAINPGTVNVDLTAVSAVPEPQTYGMLLAGLAVIGVSVRRRRMPVVSRSLALS